MVSFWPWKVGLQVFHIAWLTFNQGNDNSPASFEKSLSAIAKKITTANARLESSRQQSRRYKALWTLYASIAYLLYSMIVGLVVGLKHSSIVELGALFGGPLAIYAVRQAITGIYTYRISSQQANLEGLQKQRDGIITRLKEATKYDSTQQLLEKYGGTPAKPKKNPSNKRSSEEEQERIPQKPGRTMIVPPPTANIPRGPLTAPHTPPKQDMVAGLQPPLTAAAAAPPWPQHNSPVSPLDDSAEFAPNAFPPANYYAQPGADYSGGTWYDRLMDVLLGEDESHPKNRIVLICKDCRLVNGQAPPGVKSLTDVGKWRCSSCRSMNGEETEMQKIVAEIEHEQSNLSGMAKVEETSEEEAGDLDQSAEEIDITQYTEDMVDGKPLSTGRETRSVSARKGRKHEGS